VEIRPAPTLGSIAAALLEHVVEEARADLRSEHPASAVELYFGPIGCQALPSDSITRGSCSIDGYYTSDVDPHQPWIFYADDVHKDRARFTIPLRNDEESSLVQVGAASARARRPVRMGLPPAPMTVNWPADTKLFVRGTTATRKGHSGPLRRAAPLA
jgi:hypothetical protein